MSSSPYLPLEAVALNLVQDDSIVASVVSPMWAEHLADCHNRWLAEDGRPIQAERTAR